MNEAAFRQAIEERYLGQSIGEFLANGGNAAEYARQVFAREIFGPDTDPRDEELGVETESDLIEALEALARTAEPRQAWGILHADGSVDPHGITPVDGEWFTHFREPALDVVERGPHMHDRLIDALRRGPTEPGAMIARFEVERSAKVARARTTASIASEKRRVIWRLDGETSDRVLTEYARWCAEQVLHLWDAPQVVRDWLATGDENLIDAARAAAREAHRAEAWDSSNAAKSAAWCAAEAAWHAASASPGVAAKRAAASAGWAHYYAGDPYPDALTVLHDELERRVVAAHE